MSRVISNPSVSLILTLQPVVKGFLAMLKENWSWVLDEITGVEGFSGNSNWFDTRAPSRRAVVTDGVNGSYLIKIVLVNFKHIQFSPSHFQKVTTVILIKVGMTKVQKASDLVFN